jgi:hypothetical protein
MPADQRFQMKVLASGARVRPPPILRVAKALLSALLLVAPVALAQDLAKDTGTAKEDSQDGQNIRPQGKFDPVRFMNAFASHYYLHPASSTEPYFVFFPPVPPPLESEIPVLAPFDSGPPAPEELGAFVGEVFYPSFGTRLVSGDLPKPMRARIVDYRYSKVGLQNELRSRILALSDSDPGTRTSRLEELAAAQAPHISALETAAENLRSELRSTKSFVLPVENEDPGENLGRHVHAVHDTPTDPAGLAREIAAIQAAAFFQDGLTLEQRKLLLEASMEFAAKINPAAGANLAAPGMRLLFFSPTTSRIIIPANLPAPLEERLAEYTAAKGHLKAELRDQLSDLGDASAETRRAALVALAAEQTPEMARTEALADEIRRGLVSIPIREILPTAPPIPPELASRISDYRRHKLELLKALRALLAAPSPPARGDGSQPGQLTRVSAAGNLAWMHDGSTTTEVQSNELRVSVAEFDQRQNELIAGLNKEEAAIRESLAAYVRSTGAPPDRKSVNDLLKDFEDARQKQEVWDRYRDYYSAVMLPGLSAGQRRLLLDAAVEQLALPLPVGQRIN